MLIVFRNIKDLNGMGSKGQIVYQKYYREVLIMMMEVVSKQRPDY